MTTKSVDYLLVPAPMLIHVAAHNLETPFQLFLLLKSLFRAGKAKMTSAEIQAVAQIMGYADSRQVRRQLKEMQELSWVRYNTTTGYYILCSFDQLRISNSWKTRSAMPVYFNDLNRLSAIIGAAVYTYLYNAFRRKLKREGSVRIQGRTYHSMSASLFSKGGLAPVATTGLNALFNISVAKASRLKKAAVKEGLIQVIKDFVPKNCNPNELELIKKYSEAPNLRMFQGKVSLQQIDLIYPLIKLKKRQRLKTYCRDY